MAVELLHYPDTVPERIDVFATCGDTIEVVIDEMVDDLDPDDLQPYPVEDADLTFRAQIRKRDGTLLLDSDEGEEEIEIVRHTGTHLTDDPSYLILRVPYAASDASLPRGIYRWDLQKTDAAEDTRVTMYVGDWTMRDDVTRP